MDKAELSIVTVTYNSADFIERYLSSLMKRLPARSEVIIVDNSSSDNTVSIVKKFPKVKLVASPDNLGFSRGCNLGARQSRGQYLFFLNPDTEVLDHSTAQLVNFLKGNPQVGLVAPRLLTPDGKVHRSVINLPTLRGAIREYLLGKKNAYSQYCPPGKRPIEVEAAYGAAMLLSRQDFEAVHGFDERYFLYYEDLDLCRKIRSLGKKIIYFPGAKFVHLLGASMRPGKKLPFGLRTLALFLPIRGSGSQYYQVKSGNIYHGVLIATLLRILSYIAIKLNLTK